MPGPDLNGVSALEVLKTKLPSNVVEQMEQNPSQINSILADYVKTNRKTMEDDVFESILDFQKAAKDEEVQKARAEAHNDAVKDVQKQKEEAAKLTEQSKVETRGLTVTNYANEEGNAKGLPQETQFQLTAPTDSVDVQSKKELKKQIRENASYTDKDGVVHQGKEDLKAEYKRQKAAAKETKKEYKELEKQLKELPEGKKYRALSEEQQAEVDKKRNNIGGQQYVLQTKANRQAEELLEAKTAYKTSKGRGVGRMAKAERRIQKTNNDIAEREFVYATKDDFDAAVKAGKATKDNASYLDNDTIQLLSALKGKAVTELGKPQTSNDEVDMQRLWGALSKIEVPQAGDTPEEIARKTRINQTALRTLAGGDNTISETEKQAILKADGAGTMGLGKTAEKFTRTDINHLFKQYGLHHEDRLKGKLRDAGNAALASLPAALATALSIRFSKATSEAFAHASQVTEVTAKATAVAHAVATAVAQAEVSVPGFTWEQFDPDTQRMVYQEIAGQYGIDVQEVTVEDLQKVTTEVKGTAKAEANAHAKATAQNGWGKALTGAAITVGVAAIVGFLTSKGEENGINGKNKDYKDAQFLSMYQGTAAKGIGQELLEARDDLAVKLSGDPENPDYVGANRQLAQAYRAYEGIQNSVMTIEELAALRDGFKDYVVNYQKPEVKPQETVETKPVNPVQGPDETEEEEIVGDAHNDKKVIVENKANYFFNIKGNGASQYMNAVYPGFEKLKPADRQKVINAFKQANPYVWGRDYDANRNYDDLNGGKYKDKGLPVYFPTVDLGNGRVLVPDLNAKPKPIAINPRGKAAPKADNNNHNSSRTEESWGAGKEHVEGEPQYKTREEAVAADKKRKEEERRNRNK